MTRFPPMCFANVWLVSKNESDYGVLSGPGVAVLPQPRKRYRTSVSKYDAERQEQIRVRLLRAAKQLVIGGNRCN